MALGNRIAGDPRDEPPRVGKHMAVAVSILMPTLNSARFLEERIESIRTQTLQDWELLVADSGSDDGTWEWLRKRASLDSRFRLFRVPREGVYKAINFLLEKARGTFIYVATSDDTMESRCLQRMRAALDEFPCCDICHTTLKVIDADGNEIPGWWDERPATKYFGEMDEKKHIRYAPHDGILHICLNGVFGSLTQILVRRSAFQKIGLFRSDWGPSGDFEWGMRAGIVCSTIHLPEALATWRIHDDQLTQKPRGDLLTEMTRTALPCLEERYPDVYRSLNMGKLLSFYRRLEVLQYIQKGRYRAGGIGPVILSLCRQPKLTAQVLFIALQRKDERRFEDRIRYMRRHMEDLNLSRLVVPLECERAAWDESK